MKLLQNWAQSGTNHNPRLWAQLNHPGKQAPRGLNAETVAPSAIPFNPALQVIQSLAAAGLDLVENSGGTYEAPAMSGHRVADSTRRREAYFLEFAETVRAAVKVPLAVTGGFRTAKAWPGP